MRGTVLMIQAGLGLKYATEKGHSASQQARRKMAKPQNWHAEFLSIPPGTGQG
jgi:hypothetical protein